MNSNNNNNKSGGSRYYEAMLNDMLRSVNLVEASDLHIVAGSVPVVRLRAEIMPLSNFSVMTPRVTENLAKVILRQQKFIAESALDEGEIDMAFTNESYGRYRVNIYRQKGSTAIAIRALPSKVKSFQELGLPSVLKQFAYKSNGLILVTGPTGSGKSTTLAAIIDLINRTRRSHIITIEDPIEYVYDHGLSLISQREVGRDTQSFANALRGALREDPDVILVGEMRDPETISIALTAAETGHLVLSTLHTVGAAKTIDRIVDVFPSDKQNQIQSQLSGVLQGVVSQVLIPKNKVKGVALATEIMLATPAINNLIREGKPHQIANVLQTNIDTGMHTLDYDLERLCLGDVISLEEATIRCQNEVGFRQRVSELEVF